MVSFKKLLIDSFWLCHSELVLIVYKQTKKFVGKENFSKMMIFLFLFNAFEILINIRWGCKTFACLLKRGTT